LLVDDVTPESAWTPCSVRTSRRRDEMHARRTAPVDATSSRSSDAGAVERSGVRAAAGARGERAEPITRARAAAGAARGRTPEANRLDLHPMIAGPPSPQAMTRRGRTKLLWGFSGASLGLLWGFDGASTERWDNVGTCGLMSEDRSHLGQEATYLETFKKRSGRGPPIDGDAAHR
jgi:hypothetical protein